MFDIDTLMMALLAAISTIGAMIFLIPFFMWNFAIATVVTLSFITLVGVWYFMLSRVL